MVKYCKSKRHTKICFFFPNSFLLLHTNLLFFLFELIPITSVYFRQTQNVAQALEALEELDQLPITPNLLMQVPAVLDTVKKVI